MPAKDQNCVVVYFNPDATQPDLEDFQAALEAYDQAQLLDFSQQGYFNGFGAIVSDPSTTRTIGEA